MTALASTGTSTTNGSASFSSTPPLPPQAISLDDWTYTGGQLDAEEFEPVKMIVPGILPIGLGILVAKPKIGKSFFSLQLCLAVAQGGEFLGRKLEQGSALYFGLEDSNVRLQQRSRYLNEDEPLPEALRFYRNTRHLPNLTEIEELITAWANDVPDPTLVVIDTMGRALPKKAFGTDNYEHYTTILGSLQSLALSLDLAILLVHHVNKNHESADDFDQVHGSIGINGAADTILLINRSRGAQTGTLSVTGRDLEEVINFPIEQRGVRWYVSGARNHREILDVSDQRLKVLNAVSGGATKKSAIDAAVGISPSAAGNALKALVDSGHLVRPGHGLYELAPGIESKLREIDELSEPSEDPVNSGETPEAVLDRDPMPDFEIEF